MMSEGSLTILWVILLLAANGFFVAAEFALVKARGFRIGTLVEEGRFGAKLTAQIQGRLESYLAACQLGITMASLGLGWVGEPAVAAVLEPWFRSMGLSEQALHTTAFLVGFVIFSSLHIVIGEQVPKTFAIRKPEPVSLWCAWPLQVFYWLAFPLNWALARTTAAILSLFGVSEASHAEVISDEELRGIIDTSREHGALEESKAAMMTNLFAFDVRTVARVMIPRGDIVALDVQASPADNLRVLTESAHSRFPVVDGDSTRVLGIALAKDLYAALLSEGDLAWARLKDFIREPLFVPEILRVALLFEAMRQARAHMALVVDEYGETAGLVTMEDLLEEIVGDIDDETDEETPRYGIEESTEGWIAHGLASLSDIYRATGLEVPPDLDANTLSGLLMHRLSRMPEVGDVIREGQHVLKVLEMHEHRVEKVALRTDPDSAPAQPPKPADDDDAPTREAP